MEVINERIRIIYKSYNITLKSFSEALDISEGTLKSMFNRGTNPSFEIIKKITNAYPDISLDWLITGKGEMLKRDTEGGINLSNVGSGNIANAGTMSNVQPYPNNAVGSNLAVDDGIVKDDKDQQIILLKEKVQHLEEMLQEKERFIQVLLKNS